MSLSALILAALDEPAVAAKLREVLGTTGDPRWLSLREAAKLAGDVEPRVISEAARRGELQLGHAGRTPLVEVGELRRWIERRVDHRDAKPENDSHGSAAEAAKGRVLERMRRAG